MQIIAGLFKGRNILTPKGLKTRPTSSRLRETLFNICQGYENPTFLDLFAGSGAMGLEALSRGASHAVFVDNSRESIRCIKSNIKNLGVESSTEVFYGDVFEVLLKLAKMGHKFEIIYADPPYDQLDSAKILNMIDELSENLLANMGAFFLEEAIGSMPENQKLKNIRLKNCRKAGRSALQYYVHNKDF